MTTVSTIIIILLIAFLVYTVDPYGEYHSDSGDKKFNRSSNTHPQEKHRTKESGMKNRNATTQQQTVKSISIQKRLIQLPCKLEGGKIKCLRLGCYDYKDAVKIVNHLVKKADTVTFIELYCAMVVESIHIFNDAISTSKCRGDCENAYCDLVDFLASIEDDLVYNFENESSQDEFIENQTTQDEFMEDQNFSEIENVEEFVEIEYE